MTRRCHSSIRIQIILAISRLIFISILLILPLSVIGQKIADSFPLFEIKPSISPKELVFYVTGDGGWNSFSKNLCGSLAAKGFSVVALDSKKYFWVQKTPDTFSADVSKMVKHYQDNWNIKDWILIGYSFGADVAPFIVSRITKKECSLPKVCILLEPSTSTDFEIRLVDMLQMSNVERKYDVVAEIKKLTRPTLCVFPGNENAFLDIKEPMIQTKQLPGDHQFNSNLSGLTEIIFSFIQLH